MVEFALVAPVFLLVVFATIDYGGYFGVRLSVEDAARAGARVAAVQPYGSDFSVEGTAIVTAITGHSNVALVPGDVDCTWNGRTLAPTAYPPFTLPDDHAACIGIWYFELTGAGPPWLCGEYSVQSSSWAWWDSSGQPAGSRDTYCVTAGDDLVVVGVGYKYSPLTPMPEIVSTALGTYGETQLLEEA